MSSDAQGAGAKKSSSFWIVIAAVAVCLAVMLFCLVGVLVALLLPAIQAAREAARRNICTNNMRQIGLALLNYESTYRTLPPAYFSDAEGKPMHSWRVLILPFMDRKDLYDQYDFNEAWNGPHNSQLADKIGAVYSCPSSDDRPSETNYVAVVGPETVWPNEKSTSISRVRDGTSGTILLVEVAGSGIGWLEPKDLTFDEALRGVNAPGAKPNLSSRHPGMVNALFCDGSVQPLEEGLPAETLRARLTANAGD